MSVSRNAPEYGDVLRELAEEYAEAEFPRPLNGNDAQWLAQAFIEHADRLAAQQPVIDAARQARAAGNSTRLFQAREQIITALVALDRAAAPPEATDQGVT